MQDRSTRQLAHRVRWVVDEFHAEQKHRKDQTVFVAQQGKHHDRINGPEVVAAAAPTAPLEAHQRQQNPESQERMGQRVELGHGFMAQREGGKQQRCKPAKRAAPAEGAAKHTQQHRVRHVEAQWNQVKSRRVIAAPDQQQQLADHKYQRPQDETRRKSEQFDP